MADVFDELLYSLIEDLLEQGRNGQHPAVEETIKAHPELESEIRELWATAMIAEDFGTGFAESLSTKGATDDLTGSTTAPLMPERIADYELLEELGRGGMGIVYKAHQPSLSRTVALKMILRGEWASETDYARFQAEASAAGRLSHPHIVPIYEVGQHEGQPFFSMQYIPGMTLGQRIADGPLPSREAAELLIPICRAIQEAHNQGVLHRDLKASNILIDQEGRPYVTDFGLAKRVETDLNADPAIEPTLVSLTHSGAILGTPGYMAPEQAAGQRGEVSAATDVYSLGAILYATLTGRPPFQAASPVDTVLMVLEQDPLPPRLLNQKTDADLEMIVLKCLQKPADLRYQSAEELAKDLEAYLAHEPISARTSHFSQIISRAFRETHHAGVLENWGLLWMWHSLVLLTLCLVTNAFQFLEVSSRWPYVVVWVLGLSVWAGFFWNLRRRSGPITFVERQIAHIWAGSVVASSLLFAVEILLDLPVLSLSPVLGLISGMVFLAKAGILSGAFYVQAFGLFLTAVIMAAMRRSDVPDLGLALFGFASASSFFFPGLKYYRQRVHSEQS